MQRRTNISTKYCEETDRREGVTFCHHCNKKFEDGDDIIIDRDHVIDRWDMMEATNGTIPVRHPRYHVGCYFLLKSQDKLGRPNVQEMKSMADYHNWQASQEKKLVFQESRDSIFGKMTRRRKK